MSVSALLADCMRLGITLEAHKGKLRCSPRSKLTPALLDRLQQHKAELLQALDSDLASGELKNFVAKLWKDPVWVRGWEHRFAAARYADLDALRRVLELIVELAEEHLRRGDRAAFESSCRYLRRLASGELWDSTTASSNPSAWTSVR